MQVTRARIPQRRSIAEVVEHRRDRHVVERPRAHGACGSRRVSTAIAAILAVAVAAAAAIVGATSVAGDASVTASITAATFIVTAAIAAAAMAIAMAIAIAIDGAAAVATAAAIATAAAAAIAAAATTRRDEPRHDDGRRRDDLFDARRASGCAKLAAASDPLREAGALLRADVPRTRPDGVPDVVLCDFVCLPGGRVHELVQLRDHLVVARHAADAGTPGAGDASTASGRRAAGERGACHGAFARFVTHAIVGAGAGESARDAHVVRFEQPVDAHTRAFGPPATLVQHCAVGLSSFEEKNH